MASLSKNADLVYGIKVKSPLKLEYKKKRREIKRRLKEFREMQNSGDEAIFSELCFCILTPQTKAVNCDNAVKELKNSDLLFKGNKDTIRKILKGNVRFHNNKARYLVAARKLFSTQGGSACGGKNGTSLDIKSRLDANDALKTRDWFVNNIKGLGYKEASHFLRNIGLGNGIAIIDRHILENLKRHGVIDKIPNSISKKSYIDIENRMRKFSRRVKIPLEELDLLFWSNQTGFIFK